MYEKIEKINGVLQIRCHICKNFDRENDSCRKYGKDADTTVKKMR